MFLLILLDAFFCTPKKNSGRKSKKKMSLNSRLTEDLTELRREIKRVRFEIKREIGEFQNSMTNQHRQIMQFLDKMQREGGGKGGEGSPDYGSGGGDGSGDSGPPIGCVTKNGIRFEDAEFDCDDNCNTCKCVCRSVHHHYL